MKDANGTLIATYRYDALGRRVRKYLYAGNIEIDSVWDGWRMIEEHEGPIGGATADIAARWFVYGNGIDEPLMMHVKGDIPAHDKDYYYHQDALGSVAALTDATGSVAERYEYDPYGAHVRIVAAPTPTPTPAPNAPSNLGNPFLFAGRQFDAESGLYYNRHRYYNPALGRFISTDPISYHGGINLYEYTGSQPINCVDPLGLETREQLKQRTGLGDRTLDYLFSQDETSELAQKYNDIYSSDANSNRGDVTVGYAARRDAVAAFNDGVSAIRTVGGISNAGLYVSPVGLPLMAGDSINSAMNHDWQGALLNALPFIGMGLGKMLQDVSKGLAEETAAVSNACKAEEAGTEAASIIEKNARSTEDLLSDAAKRAAQIVGDGKGPIYGTRVHTSLKTEVELLGGNLRSEVSYLNGIEVRYGKPGSIRLDVVEYDANGNIKAVYDLKTGNAKLTPARIQGIRSHLPGGGMDILVIELRP